MKTKIKRLRQRIREVTGEDPVFGTSPDCPPEVEEAFLEKILAFEMCPRRVLVDLLKEGGVDLPRPEDLNDKQLTAKLWEVIHALLARYIVVGNTDHLDDRQLYTVLCKEFLREEYVMSPNHTIHVDVTRTGPDDGMPIYLKYYATEAQRELYSKIHPEFEMPDHIEPPRRRDHLIPDDPTEHIH